MMLKNKMFVDFMVAFMIPAFEFFVLVILLLTTLPILTNFKFQKFSHLFREEYPELGPSILSDAWLAIQGPRSLYLGSTWEWRSRNSSPDVSTSEASQSLEELLPKAYAIYPNLENWTFASARAGLRAMPPLTPHGSLPLMGCVDDIVRMGNGCKYWLFGGLGARGLLYHGWLGKLLAQAVLECNEQLIPSELTLWKNKNP